MKRRRYSRLNIAYQHGGHTSNYAHWMQCYRAGAYDIDKREPESMDLPEVCSFRADDGLLGRKELGPCSDKIIVVDDKEFGVIPICTNHSKLSIRSKTHGVRYVPKQYLQTQP